jgi:L-lactate dehydrogenase (cytochrome)
MELARKFPTVDDLERATRRRIPKFAFDYLAGGAGDEAGLAHNRRALDEIRLVPQYLNLAETPDLSVELLGHRYSLPFGISPVGLGGLIWPRAAEYLAEAARLANIPFCLSMVATSSIETIGPLAGECGWFQHYPLGDAGIEEEILERARDAGFRVLVVTIDVPVSSRRVRNIRNGLAIPPKMTARNLVGIATHPAWALATLADGPPRFQTLLPYFPKGAGYKSVGEAIQSLTEGIMDWQRIEKFRRIWKGPLVIKGVLDAAEAKRHGELGVDGLILSNHGGRQLDAAVSPIEVLPGVRLEVGPEMPLMLDSGLRSGTDIARAFALGADFTFLGRAFMYGVGALGRQGARHAIELLRAELSPALGQMGCRTPLEAPGRLFASG